MNFKQASLFLLVMCLFDVVTTTFFFALGNAKLELNTTVYPFLYDRVGLAAPITYLPIEYFENLAFFVFGSLFMGWWFVPSLLDDVWTEDDFAVKYLIPIIVNVILLYLVVSPLIAGLGWWEVWISHGFSFRGYP